MSKNYVLEEVIASLKSTKAVLVDKFNMIFCVKDAESLGIKKLGMLDFLRDLGYKKVSPRFYENIQQCKGRPQ